MKKTFFIFITIGVIIALVGGTAYWRHYLARQRHYQEVKNQKAPEIQVTLIEGWTVQDIAGYLEKQNLAQAGDFLAAEQTLAHSTSTAAYPFLSSKPAAADLEGFIFPDTYRLLKYPAGSGSQLSYALITKALENFGEKFTQDDVTQARRDGLTPFQIVTLASIIEKETGREAVNSADRQALQTERNIIAGIFYNRLRIGQPLESDATINYLTKKNTPRASAQDLQIDSPYNTYKYAGLPPGPIANPSSSSLQAALFPASTDYYYFLHAPDGQVIYSKTYQEHLQNKSKYLK